MKKKLLLLSFVEGAAVMAAELCGAKLLAPIYGSSLYVWATVMGFTLAALAGGYFFGGQLTAREKDHPKTLASLLNFAAIFLLAMPVIAYYLVPRISYLSFTAGVIISTALLLLPAVFLLGSTSPLFILLQTPEQKEAGKVSGTVYAVSTAGGIFATFLCGFVLIPDLGLTSTLLSFGLLLFGLNSILNRHSAWLEIFLAFVFCYLIIQILQQKTTVLSKSDSILGRLQVTDELREKEIVRVLKINDIIQSEMRLSDSCSVSEYIGLLDTLIPSATKKERALVLGLGGGLTANLLSKKKYQTSGVEFDTRIIEAAHSFFYLDPRVTAIEGDARQFINRTKERYQIILADLFKAEEQPSHVLTLESLRALKQLITADGLLMISWHGYLSGERGKGSTILINTLKEAGFHVRFCSMSKSEDFRNIVFVASLMPLQPQAYELKEALTETALLNTDDCPRLEKYNASANKSWRTSYLRFYQKGSLQ